ncbi:MAG TPA: DNA polymerase III subunit delta [Rhizomicrobium sp.]|jgi:DNA polymerase-3 subunit delta
MIVKASDADRFVSRPPPGIAAILVYGPDQGLVRERAETAAKSVVPDLNDPFRVTDFPDGTLESDPARLFDEAAAISMLGGRRLLRVRGAGNGLAKLLDDFLVEHVGDALVVVEAGDLAKSAALRKAFEDADAGAAVACYPDSQDAIANVVRNALKADGISITADALDEAVSRLGSDRGVTRREIEKLALYARGQKEVTAKDVLAVMGDESETRSEDICDAAGEGDHATLDRELEKLWTAGTNPAQVIRTALSHFQRVLLVKIAVSRGEPVDGAMRKGWPQIHFSRANSFKSQVSRWSEERLSEACDLLLETEALSRTTAVPAEAVTGRALFTIAAMAKMRDR